MKILKLVFIQLWIAFAVVAQSKHPVYHQKSPNKIKVDEKAASSILKEIKSGKAYLIDVRSPEEYQEKHLAQSLNIPLKSEAFLNQLAQLDKSKKLYIYCRSGNRSGQATDSLIQLGYSSSYNIGGLDSLVSKGFKPAASN